MRSTTLLIALLLLCVQVIAEDLHVIEIWVNTTRTHEDGWVRLKEEFIEERSMSYNVIKRKKEEYALHESAFESEMQDSSKALDELKEALMKDKGAMEQLLQEKLAELKKVHDTPPSSGIETVKVPLSEIVWNKVNMTTPGIAEMMVRVKLSIIDYHWTWERAKGASNAYFSKAIRLPWFNAVLVIVVLVAPLLYFRHFFHQNTVLERKVIDFPLSFDVGSNNNQPPPPSPRAHTSDPPSSPPPPSTPPHDNAPPKSASPIRTARQLDPNALPFKSAASRRVSDTQSESKEEPEAESNPLKTTTTTMPEPDATLKAAIPSSNSSFTDVTQVPPAIRQGQQNNTAPKASSTSTSTSGSTSSPPAPYVPTPAASHPPTLRTRSPSIPKKPQLQQQPQDEKKPEMTSAQITNEWFDHYRNANKQGLERQTAPSPPAQFSSTPLHPPPTPLHPSPTPPQPTTKSYLDLPLVEPPKPHAVVQPPPTQPQSKPQSTTPRPASDADIESSKPTTQAQQNYAPSAPPVLNVSDDEELPESSSHSIAYSQSQSMPNIFPVPKTKQPTFANRAASVLDASPLTINTAPNPATLSPEIQPDSRSLRKNANKKPHESEEPEPQPPSSPTAARSRSTSVDSESLQITRRNQAEKLKGTPPPQRRDMRSSIDSTTPKREIEMSDNFESELEAEPQPDSEQESDLEM